MGKTSQDVECGTKIIERCEEEMEDKNSNISYKKLSNKTSTKPVTQNYITSQLISKEVSVKELLSKRTKKEALI